MASRLCTAIVIACIALVSGAEAASTVSPANYFFYARVTSGNGPKIPAIGSIIPISITVDTSFPAYSQKNHVTMYYGGPGYDLPSPILAASINGVQVLGLFDDVYVALNDNGMYSITLLTYAFGDDAALTLTLSTTLTGVVKNDHIPAKVFPGNFQTATFSATFDPTDSFSGQIVE